MKLSAYLNPSQVIPACLGALVEKKRRHRLIPGPRLNPQWEEHLRQVEQVGLAIVPGFFSADQCNSLKDEIDRILERHPEAIVDVSEGADKRLFGADRASQSIRAFWENSQLRQVAMRYTGGNEVNGFAMANLCSAIPGNRGSGNGWHRDSVRGRQFKAILYLTDVTTDSGPFQYWKRSHRPWHRMTSTLRLGRPFYENRFDDGTFNDFFDSLDDVVTITAPQGSVVLVDTIGLHRGKPLAVGCRYALTNYYYCDTPVPPHIADYVNRVPLA